MRYRHGFNLDSSDGNYDPSDDEPTDTDIAEQKVDNDEDALHEELANKF